MSGCGVASPVGVAALFGATGGPGVAGMFAAIVAGVDVRIFGNGSLEKMLKSWIFGGFEVSTLTLTHSMFRLTQISSLFCCLYARRRTRLKILVLMMLRWIPPESQVPRRAKHSSIIFSMVLSVALPGLAASRMVSRIFSLNSSMTVVVSLKLDPSSRRSSENWKQVPYARSCRWRNHIMCK